MNDARSVPLTTLTVYLLWIWVAVSLTASWSLMISGDPHVAFMFGITSCVSTGVAVVASVRCYVLRVFSLIRNLHGLEHLEPLVVPAGIHGLP